MVNVVKMDSDGVAPLISGGSKTGTKQVSLFPTDTAMSTKVCKSFPRVIFFLEDLHMIIAVLSERGGEGRHTTTTTTNDYSGYTSCFPFVSEVPKTTQVLRGLLE